MKWKDFIRNHMKEYFENKKVVYNLIIILCVGIGIIITVDALSQMNRKNADKEKTTVRTTETQNVSETAATSGSYEKVLENKLTEILQKIDGAGHVSVMITLESTDEVELAKNYVNSGQTTTEKDTQGGEREIKQTNQTESVVLVNVGNGGTKPIVIKELSPKVEGVVVVAEGAKDAKVKESLYHAVETALGISIYKISVFERN